MSPGPLAVIGAGSWGTALAQLLADRGVDPDMVERVDSHLAASERVRFAPGSGDEGSGEGVLDETAGLVADLANVEASASPPFWIRLPERLK